MVVRKSFVRSLIIPAAIAASFACSTSSNNSSPAKDGGALLDGDTGNPRSLGGESSDAAQSDAETAPTDGGSTDAEAVDAGDATGGTSSEGGVDDASADAGPSAPAVATAAGFTHLVFEDDFTTSDSIAPTKTAASGYKWYWSFQVHETPTPWTVSPTATAASFSDAGPGTNASPAGGILTLSGPGSPNSAITTVPGWALGAADASAPPTGQGNWKHAYFEAYLQTRINGNTSTDASSGWPAFWSWSIAGLRNFGYGNTPIHADASAEIDFFETYGTIFGQTPGNWTATMHQWPANAASDGHNNKTDDGWHTYGCLWTSTGAGVGQVKFYFDGTQVDSTVDSGAGQTQFSLETAAQFMILGTGNDWDLNVDWVRVWQ